MVRIRTMLPACALGSLVACASGGCFGAIDSRASSSGGDGTVTALPPSGPVDAGSEPATPSATTTFAVVGYAGALANDDQYVYWSDIDGIYRATKTSPHPEAIIPAVTTTSIVTDAELVYVIDSSLGVVRAWPQRGGASQVVFPGAANATMLAGDAVALYVAQRNGGGVLVVSKSSHETTATLRAGASVLQVAVTGDLLYTAEEDPQVGTKIMRSRVDGTGDAVEAGYSDARVDLVAADGDAFWVGTRGLMSTTRTKPLYATDDMHVLQQGVVVVGEDVYAVESSHYVAPFQRLLRVRRDGRGLVDSRVLPATFVEQRVDARLMTGDATRLFMTSEGRPSEIVSVPVF